MSSCLAGPRFLSVDIPTGVRQGMDGVSAVCPMSRDQVSANIQRLRKFVDGEVIQAWISKAVERAQRVPWPRSSPPAGQGGGHCEGAACDLSAWLEAEQINLMHNSLVSELPGDSKSLTRSLAVAVHKGDSKTPMTH